MRDVRGHVRLLEQGLDDPEPRPHVYSDLLGHPLLVLPLVPGSAVVAEKVHGVAVNTAGELFVLVGSKHERIEYEGES